VLFRSVRVPLRQATGLLNGSIRVPGLRTLALVSKGTCQLRVKTVKIKRIWVKLQFMQSRSGLSSARSFGLSLV